MDLEDLSPDALDRAYTDAVAALVGAGHAPGEAGRLVSRQLLDELDRRQARQSIGEAYLRRFDVSPTE